MPSSTRTDPFAPVARGTTRHRWLLLASFNQVCPLTVVPVVKDHTTYNQRPLLFCNLHSFLSISFAAHRSNCNTHLCFIF